jgi:hypothetical protein
MKPLFTWIENARINPAHLVFQSAKTAWIGDCNNADKALYAIDKETGFLNCQLVSLYC